MYHVVQATIVFSRALVQTMVELAGIKVAMLQWIMGTHSARTRASRSLLL